MRQSKIKALALEMASKIPQHNTENLIREAKKVEQYILGYGDRLEDQVSDIVAEKAKKSSYEVFEKAFVDKVANADFSRLELDAVTAYEKYLKDPVIYDVDYFIENTMRHLSSMTEGLYLKPLIDDPLVKETYRAQVQNPSKPSVIENCIVVTLKSSATDTEITITVAELRKLLDASSNVEFAYVHDQE